MNYIKYLVDIPFNICVHFLLGMGKVLHLNYVQISVIFNLWIQGTILMISGVIPFILYIYFVLTDKIALNIELLTAVGLMSIVYIATYSIMLVHYRLPYQRTFDLCVNDLLRIGKYLNHSYNFVNIIIFIVLYIILLLLNAIITWYIIP